MAMLLKFAHQVKFRMCRALRLSAVARYIRSRLLMFEKNKTLAHQRVETVSNWCC